MPQPLRLAFLGCGFITRVHSRHLRALGGEIVCGYASRDRAKADGILPRVSAALAATPTIATAIADPAVDAVVVAVPPRFHLDLTLQALAAGKHVLVEKPAFLTHGRLPGGASTRATAPGASCWSARTITTSRWRCTLRRLLADGAIGEMVFAHFTTIAHRLKTADDWRNDEAMAGGDAFFEEGIHWLHLAGSLGPTIIVDRTATGRRRRATGPDTRVKSMMVAFRYDNGAVGSLYYSREIPSLLQGLRLSKLFGRDGVITFESNGAFVLVARRRAAAAACSRASATSAATRRCIATSSRAIRERPRAGDEPRARDRGSAADGPDLREPSARPA